MGEVKLGLEEFRSAGGEWEGNAAAGELAFAAGGEVAVIGGLAGGVVIEAEGFAAEGRGAASAGGLVGFGGVEGVAAEDAEFGPRCRC